MIFTIMWSVSVAVAVVIGAKAGYPAIGYYILGCAMGGATWALGLREEHRTGNFQ